MANSLSQFVVFGLGRFGTAITKALHNAGAEVLVVDRDEEKINEIVPFCTHAACADTTDENSMRKLGINNMDVAIVCIASEVDSSIFTTLLCKQMGVPKVIAKAANEKHKLVLERIGANLVIIPETAMGEKLAATLLKPNMIEVLSLTNDFRMVEIRAPKKWVGKTLAQLDLRNSEGISVILIKRGEAVEVNPGAAYKINNDDLLVVAGSVHDTKRLSNKATETVNTAVEDITL